MLNKDDEAIAYAITRMPATYGATKTACSQIVEILNLIKNEKMNLNNFKTLIDIGAGTGAATLAINEFFNLEKITCFEREEAMIKLGKTLLAASSYQGIKNTNWIKLDLNNLLEKEVEFNESADIVISSYMLNEFAEEKLLRIVEKMWKMTGKLLIIVDPGTPKDHKRLLKIKDCLSELGGNILAPCTCDKECGLPETDWCHFSCRIERTKLQKEAKMANVPYEDEKFTYLAVLKFNENIDFGNFSRIIRHPVIRNNMVEVKLCSKCGITNKIFTKKDKELYKIIRKSKVGDIINNDSI